MSAIQFIDAGHSLSERIFHALQRHPHLIGRRVSYEIVEENVVLTGFVRTYFQKQMAQESLRNIPGISRIINELEVISQ